MHTMRRRSCLTIKVNGAGCLCDNFWRRIDSGRSSLYFVLRRSEEGKFLLRPLLHQRKAAVVHHTLSCSVHLCKLFVVCCSTWLLVVVMRIPATIFPTKRRLLVLVWEVLGSLFSNGVDLPKTLFWYLEWAVLLQMFSRRCPKVEPSQLV